MPKDKMILSRTMQGQVFSYLSFSKLALALAQKGKTNYKWLKKDAGILLKYVNLYGEETNSSTFS